MMRVLIIEEEAALSKTLSDKLIEGGYQADIAENLGDAKYYLDIRNYDLVLLGWARSGGNGIGIIPDIKNNAHKTSVMSFPREKIKRVKLKHCVQVQMISSENRLIMTSFLYVLKPNFVLVPQTLLRSKSLSSIRKRRRSFTRV